MVAAGRPKALSIDSLRAATLAVGFERMSVAAVARELGVTHSTIYNYVTGREELEELALDAAVRSVAWPDLERPWREMLVSLGDAIWAVLDRYPGLAESIGRARQAPRSVVELSVALSDALVAQGFSQREALISLDFIIDLAIGTAASLRGLDRTVTTGDDVVTVRDTQRSVWTDSRLAAMIDESTWTGRGWFDDKMAIFLRGLSIREDGSPR